MAKYTDRGFLRIPVVFSSVPLRLQPKPALAFFGYNRSGFGCNRRNIEGNKTQIQRNPLQNQEVPYTRKGILYVILV